MNKSIQEMNGYCEQSYLREKNLVPGCNILAYHKCNEIFSEKLNQIENTGSMSKFLFG